MLVLGINEGINSSVVVCEDGQITFALQEERIRRVKEYVGFPHRALEFTFRHLGLSPGDVSHVCLSNLHSPGFTREEFLAAYDRNAEQPLEALARKRPSGIRGALRNIKISFPRREKTTAVEEPEDPVNLRVEQALLEHGLEGADVVRQHHHMNHAASAYFGLRQNPHDPHLVLSLDGGGDDACAHVYVGESGDLRLLSATPPGHSVGNVYSRVTHFMGMKPHEHEYKLMGLAAYARPEYCQDVLDKFRGYIGFASDDPYQFRCLVDVSTSQIAPLLAGDFKRVRFDNLAGGLQFFTEELLLEWIQRLVKGTGIRKILCAGGVFMNVKANQRIAALPEVEYFDVFPSCGDETLPFGAVWNFHASRSPDRGESIRFESMCLGPGPGYDLEVALERFGDRLQVETVEHPERRAAELIAEGRVLARCCGPMEFGARALGNRSLLADPAQPHVVPLINKMIKQRDFWMPFAPAVLVEDAGEFVQVPDALPEGRISPFMMHTFDTTERRMEFHAGVHAYDHTARAQVVSAQSNDGFHRLIRDYKELAGKGVVLNTSFNLHGYPIVMGACDAVDVLLDSGLTHLMIENTLITKKRHD